MFLKRTITYVFLFLIAFGGFFGDIHMSNQSDYSITLGISYEGSEAYAAPTTPPVAKKDDISVSAMESYNKMIDNINIALAVLSALVSPIILFVGWLMSPDWTSGDLFGLRIPMYKLWVVVSNIVYFVYAILLILIALGTMFNQDKFSYKVMLPKLALGILMVPFTWWFVQWTISLSSVVTASVMTIPAETIKDSTSSWFLTPSIPSVISIDGTSTGSMTTKTIDCEVTPAACLTPKKFLENEGGMFSPMVVYGYSIFKFQKIDRLDGTLDVASAALKLVHTSILGTIMFAVFGILTLALAVMLFVRAVKLWVYAIFSPLFTFRFVAGSNLIGGDDDTFSLKEFIGLAFVPAVVGLTLSFGLIMINAVQTTSKSPDGKTVTTCNLRTAPGCVIPNIMGNSANRLTREILKDSEGKEYTRSAFEFAGITAVFLGKATNQSKNDSVAIGALDAVGGMFGTLIIDVIALVFIWMSFMAAKNVSKVVKGAVAPFEEIGNKVSGLAKNIPKYAPIIPSSLGGSIYGAGRVIDQVGNINARKAEEKVNNSAAGKMFGMGNQASKVDMEMMHKLMKEKITLGSNENRMLVAKGTENAGKYDDSGAIKSLGDYLNKHYQTKEQKALFLTSGGMDAETASKIALIVHSNRNIDPNTNKELEELWKKANSKGTTGTGNTGAGNTGAGSGLSGFVNKDANLKVGVTMVTLNNINSGSSADEIKTAIKSSGKDNFEGKITKDELRASLNQLFTNKDGKVDEDKINSIITGLGDTFFKK